MKQVRQKLFETNSSSTHSIVVSLERNYEPTEYDLYTSWEEYDFQFGRETYRLLDCWDYKLAYIYIVLLGIVTDYKNVVAPKVDLEKFKNRVNEIYSEVKSKFPDNTWRLHNEIPNHIFQIIEYAHSRDLGTATEEPKFEFSTDLYRHILKNSWSIYIDHTEYFVFLEGEDRRFNSPCVELLEKLQTDDDYLKTFLFSDESYITIGGDEYRGYNLKTLGFENDYNSDELWESRVAEYEKTHDVYFKGN